MATTYIYKGQEISHTRFVTLCRMAGVNGGHQKSYYQVLYEMSERGETKASELVKDLEVIDK